MITQNSSSLGTRSDSAPSAPPPPPQYTTAQLDKIAGRFGTFPAGEFPLADSADRALVGWMQVSTATTGNPHSGAGILHTLNAKGAGADGINALAATGSSREWVVQFLYCDDGSLYCRHRINNQPFSAWAKRW